MLNFFRETKAYTSIFLCLVLLPMVTYATMIIDASRLQSARVQVQSAGDLAMNAAMSEYEQVLEDMYGLFANAKSADEIEPAIRTYFEETISGTMKDSKDPEKATYVHDLADALTDYAMSAGSNIPDDVEFTNFLGMKLEESSDDYDPFVFQPVAASAISNPNIMKGQIIDYMKYKGPVSVGNNFLNKLGFLQDTKAQSDAVQKKIELSEKIAEMGGPMEDAYNAIKEYNETVDKFNDYYQDDAGNYTSKKLFNKIFYDTNDNLQEMSYLFACYRYILKMNEKYGLNDINSDESVLGFNTAWQTDEELNRVVGDDLSEETVANASAQLDKLIAPINDIVFLDTNTFAKTGTSGFENAYGAISYTVQEDWQISGVSFATVAADGSYTASYGNLYAWNQVLDLPLVVGKEYGVNFYDAFELQLELIPQVKGMSKYQAYKSYFDKIAALYNRKYEEYKKIYKAENGEETDTDSDPEFVKYSKICNLVAAISNAWTSNPTYQQYQEFIQNVTQSGTYFYSADHYRKKADDEFVAYYKIVKKLESTSKTALSKLNILLGEEAVPEGQSSIKDVNNTADDVNTQIDNVQDESAKSQMKSDVETLRKSINAEDVTKLRDAVKLYHDRFQTAKEKLESVHYFTTDRDKLYQPFGEWGNIEYANRPEYDIPLDEENIKSAMNLYAKLKIENNTYPVIIDAYYNSTPENPKSLAKYFRDMTEKIDGGIHEILNYSDDSKIKYDECFYNVLRNTANAEGQKEADGNEDSKNSLNTIQDYTNVSNDGQPTKSISVPESKTKKEAEEVSMPEKSFGDEANDFKPAHDELSPGSSAGYGKAGSGSIPNDDEDDPKGKADSGKNNLANANDLLEKIAKIGDEFKNDIYLEEYFTEMFTCLTDKKLEPGKLQLINGYSNNPKAERFINPKNAWYGCEMEYILWGKDSLQANLNTTATTIFLIRFAVNAVYAFTASDIQSMASAIAELLVGWTVVLVPVVQVCITLAVALAESTLDLEMLKQGEDVPLIKDSTTFICSPTGLAHAAADKAIDIAVDKVTTYVTDKVDEAIDNIEDVAEKKISECTSEIDDALNSYVDQQTASITSAISAQFTTPLVSTITPILSKLDETASNAQKVTEDAIEETWKSIEQNINGMDEGLVKDMTLLAFNNAKGEKDTLVREIVQKIQEGRDKTSPEAIKITIDGKVKNWVQSISTELKGKLTDKTNEMRKNILDHGEDAATNLKSYMHEEIDSFSQELSGTLKENIKDAASQVADNAVSTKSGSVAAKITMNYKEYCKLFMFIGLIDNTNESKMLQRAAVLMQLNVTYAVKGGDSIQKAGTSDFHMNSAYTLFYINADIKMGTMFPWAVKFEDDGTDATAKLDFSNLGTNSVSLKYSGIAGY